MCALNNWAMCKNNCNDKCNWDTDRFATYHVFFTADTSKIVCAHPASMFEDFVDYMAGRDCPPNTPSPTNY